ncbi:HET-domain-containing protein [Diaporthe amygdali]|uniref:HET-domain-containing protein n=1 Tax=Phomopsis amygdali TaxID=1214568 RepID=UPI0022FF2B0C|nr:HET-domain-containing protein [Diaporthe amygdali]KAJ0109497.1 HET-domain-containing protein [Diaporthe amygdali]
MSSSQDISQSPVAMRAPALSPPQISEDPLGLCRTCLEAHGAALRDDGPDWQEVDDGDTPHIETTRGPLLKHKLPADTWPDLPGLLDSAQAGCGFCDFLREAILSQDFRDVWHDLTGERITEAGRESLGLELQYASPLDLGYCNPSAGLKYLTVSVAIGNSDFKIYLVFRIEAITDCSAVTKWLVLQPRPVRNHEDDAIISFLKTELHKLPDDGNGDFLPERLIDVGTSSLRLVEGSNINASSAKQQQYSALSYCWGRREHAELQSKTTNFYRDFVYSQWARRGWTFQENAMAGARIVFGNTEVYFARDRSFATKNGYIGSEPVPSLQSDDELHEAWEKVISRYSMFTKSAFTDPKDVLPALSGLARLFGDVLKVDYIAGHWVDRLHHSLMWEDQFLSSIHDASLNALLKRHGQKPYLIPSWSSLARGIVGLEFCIPYEDCRSEITILGVDQELVGENPYGEIDNAYLTLEGYVLNLASLSWSESSVSLAGSVSGRIVEADWTIEDEYWIDEDKVLFEKDAFDPEGSRDLYFTLYDGACPNAFSAYREYVMRLDFLVESGDRSLLGVIRAGLDQLISRATLLLLGSEDIYSEDESSGVLKAGYGLVLVPLEGASERSFLRVGIFLPWRNVVGHSDDLPCLKRLMKKEKIKIY